MARGGQRRIQGFFFQAEDGIRDGRVTGVQTCALPILFFFSSRRRHTRLTCDWSSDVCSSDLSCQRRSWLSRPYIATQLRRWHDDWSTRGMFNPVRSEERRVGKECRCRRGRKSDKKKG